MITSDGAAAVVYHVDDGKDTFNLPPGPRLKFVDFDAATVCGGPALMRKNDDWPPGYLNPSIPPDVNAVLEQRDHPWTDAYAVFVIALTLFAHHRSGTHLGTDRHFLNLTEIDTDTHFQNWVGEREGDREDLRILYAIECLDVMFGIAPSATSSCAKIYADMKSHLDAEPVFKMLLSTLRATDRRVPEAFGVPGTNYLFANALYHPFFAAEYWKESAAGGGGVNLGELTAPLAAEPDEKGPIGAQVAAPLAQIATEGKKVIDAIQRTKSFYTLGVEKVKGTTPRWPRE
jgi:hypothetical protein